MISVDFPFAFTFSKNEQNVICRNWSRFSLLLFHVYAAYFFIAGVQPFFNGLDLKLGLAYMFINLLSYFLWYSMKRQERRIRRLIHMQGVLLPPDRTTDSVFLTCVIAFFNLLPFAYGGLNIYLLLYRGADYTFYSLEYPIENVFLKCLLMFLGSYGLCLVFSKWPCTALWSMCHTLTEGANILHVYDKRLRHSFSFRSSLKRETEVEIEKGFIQESLHQSNNTIRESWGCESYPLNKSSFELFGNSRRVNISTLNHRKERRVSFTSGFNMKDRVHSNESIRSSSQPLMEILTEYFKIIKMIRVLRETVSLPSLFITLLSFSSLYSILATALFGILSKETMSQEVLINGFTGCSVLVSLGYCGAKIPQRMYDIRTTCSDIINANEIDGVLDSKEISLLKRLEKVDPVHISACEFVVFSRSFIVSSFGSILTFGLLIFNFK